MATNSLTRPGLSSGSAGSLRTYVSDLQQGAKKADRLRLMLVGFGGQGKTTLARALTSNESCTDFRLRDDVSSWTCEQVREWVQERMLGPEVELALTNRDGPQLSQLASDNISLHGLSGLEEMATARLQTELHLLLNKTRYCSTVGVNRSTCGTFEIFDFAGEHSH